MAYSGRLAIITGGLGGLGSAIACTLREQGARLAILHHPSETARKEDVLRAQFGAPACHSIATYECDVASESSVAEAFEEISSAAAVLDISPSILINAAGYVTVNALEATSAQEAEKNFNINLLGPFLVSKAFHDLYTTRKSSACVGYPPGRIISLASQAAHIALNGHGPYCASKAGLLALTRSMAGEWGHKGITANTVSPTVILTGLGRKAWADEKTRVAHLRQIPIGRFGEPCEVASAVDFLCRDENGLINGADIRLDGGFTSSKF